MTSTLVVFSGYFNPLHVGHLRVIEEARTLGDTLLVVVNNDRQQLLKKGKIIVPEGERLEIVRALRDVDTAMLSVDDDATVVRTLERIRQEHPDHRIVFVNGGDRDSARDVPEAATCAASGIEMRFGVGGREKLSASSEINKRLGRE